MWNRSCPLVVRFTSYSVYLAAAGGGRLHQSVFRVGWGGSVAGCSHGRPAGWAGLPVSNLASRPCPQAAAQQTRRLAQVSILPVGFFIYFLLLFFVPLECTYDSCKWGFFHPICTTYWCVIIAVYMHTYIRTMHSQGIYKHRQKLLGTWTSSPDNWVKW